MFHGHQFGKRINRVEIFRWKWIDNRIFSIYYLWLNIASEKLSPFRSSWFFFLFFFFTTILWNFKISKQYFSFLIFLFPPNFLENHYDTFPILNNLPNVRKKAGNRFWPKISGIENYFYFNHCEGKVNFKVYFCLDKRNCYSISI